MEKPVGRGLRYQRKWSIPTKYFNSSHRTTLSTYLRHRLDLLGPSENFTGIGFQVRVDREGQKLSASQPD